MRNYGSLTTADTKPPAAMPVAFFRPLGGQRHDCREAPMFTQELADKICARLSEAESLRAICRDVGISHSLVLKWARDNEAFRDQYTRARDDGAEADFDGLQELADEPPEKNAMGSVDAGWVAWQRNRIDVRKWSLAKKLPKKYGEKIEATHEVGDSITKIVREIIRA